MYKYQNSTTKVQFNTLNSFITYKAIACKDIGYEYDLYVDYMMQFSDEKLVISEEKYNLL